jgi:hypothetical protein
MIVHPFSLVIDATMRPTGVWTSHPSAREGRPPLLWRWAPAPEARALVQFKSDSPTLVMAGIVEFTCRMSDGSPDLEVHGVLSELAELAERDPDPDPATQIYLLALHCVSNPAITARELRRIQYLVPFN